jgi:hypothetical protein
MLRSVLSYNVTRAVMGGVLFLSCFFVVWSIAGVSFSLTGEVISIGTILKNPESYNLRVVTLEGTVRNVKPFEPYFEPYKGPGGVCYGTYTFTLEDKTGSIEVAHPTLCGPPIQVPEVPEGDMALIEAQIFGLGQYSEWASGFPQFRQTPLAVVKSIRRSGK